MHANVKSILQASDTTKMGHTLPRSRRGPGRASGQLHTWLLTCL